MKNPIAITIIALIAGTSGLMAQDDEVVIAKLNVFQRIHVRPDTIQVVMRLPRELGHGIWDASGSAALFLRGREGATIYFAGAITQRIPTIDYNDATIVIGSAAIHNGRADPTIALPGRDLDIDPPTGGTVPAYMVVWVHSDIPAYLTSAEIYGWIRARKVPGT